MLRLPGRGRRNSRGDVAGAPAGGGSHPPHGGPDLDDGPHAVYTDQILDILEEHGAVATFFEVARNLPEAPEAVRRAATWAARSAPLLPPRKPGQDGSGRPAGGSGRGGRAVSGGAGHHARAAAAALWLHEQDAEDHLRPEHRHLVHRHGGLAPKDADKVVTGVENAGNLTDR